MWRLRGLQLAIVLAPLAYGTVHPLPVLLLELAGFGLFAAALFAARRAPAELARLRDPLFVLGCAGVGLGLLQVVPLPRAVLALVSPGTERLLTAAPAAGMPTVTWFPVSVVPWHTERAVVWLAALAAWYGAVRLTVRGRRDTLALTRAVAAGALALAVLGIAQKLTGATQIYWVGLARPAFFGSLVSPNMAAGLLVLGTAACLALALRRNRASPPWLAAGLVTSSAAVLTLSRGGIGVLVFCLLFTAVGMRSTGRAAGRGLAALTAGTLAFVLWVGAIEVVGELATLERDGATLNGRTEIWRAAVRMVPDFPLLGSGYGTFEAVFPVYATAPAKVRYTAAENEYLQAGLEGGLAGALLAALALAETLRRVRRALVKRRAAGVALGAGLAALLVHMLVDFPLHAGGPALWLTVFAALVAPAQNAASEAAPEPGEVAAKTA
jgi:O-antigen ligase